MRIRKELVPVKKLKSSRFCPPRDERLVQLVADVYQGKAPAWSTTVPLADLVVHHPPTLTALRSAPVYRQLQGAVLETLLDDQPALMVYRDKNGHLVMFDDYLKYAVALDADLTMVNVCIMGEAAPSTLSTIKEGSAWT